MGTVGQCEQWKVVECMDDTIANDQDEKSRRDTERNKRRSRYMLLEIYRQSIA